MIRTIELSCNMIGQ